ncbi:DUF2486 family protein [Trinickia sp. NRRL B-1857]|uniref:DUF2486 family protein n=1 Tax=Trinickia sp. NRRL B-1857 TaxID=3162879 RepID=UPI003D2AFEDA
MVEPVDPNSIPMLTDVMVPGRPAAVRPADPQPEPEHKVQAGAPAPTEPQSSSQASSAATRSEPMPAAQPTLDARDVEFIAERLRARFSTYLRRDARGVVEAHCRDAIEEHTNWLVRQVTREVVGVLEQEVAGWVRDAVSEELARHTSRR